MAIGQHKRAVGVFSHYRDAEAALNELRTSGFPMHKVSVVAQDSDGRKDVGGVGMSDRPGKEAGEGAKAGAVAGAATGGLIGLIGSLTALTIPGIGPIMAGGALASILGDTLIGGAIGAAAGGLVGALVGLGVPEDRAKGYNERVSRGDYLVLVEGTDEQIHAAETILSRGGIQDWGIYDAPVGSTGRGAGRHQRAVGVFSSRAETERALHDLRDAGFAMNKVSVIARDADREGDIAGVDVKDRVGNKADEGATTGALTGGALGGLTGLLVGLGALAIPGIGPIMLAGAEATAIATTLAGTALGATAGSLIGALVGLGIPEERAKVYGDRVARGDYLVMVNGSEEEVRHADTILNHRGIQDWGVYDAPTPTRTDDATSATTGAPGVPFPETVYDRDAKNLGH
ncbi:MAG: general stress protein [Microcoleus vaginatus WJT46-NPBG5]|nr:general stress protein [Microcoleus vaginatus WJT46-NPBG5]